jgi:hypothetical protein
MTTTTRVIWRVLPVWAGAGMVLYLLSDALFEHLFILAIVPYGGWLLAGVALFALCLREAWRARRSPLGVPLVVVIPATFGILLLVGPALEPIGTRFVCCAHPTDAALIRSFHAQRPAFERLRTMFAEDDQLGRVAPDFTRSASFFSGASLPPGPPVTEARLASYRGLFRQLRLRAGIEGYDAKQEIWFIASTRGFVMSGTAKGYVYTAKRPPTVVADLDVRPGEIVSSIRYRRIDGNWYLYFEHYN